MCVYVCIWVYLYACMWVKERKKRKRSLSFFCSSVIYIHISIYMHLLNPSIEQDVTQGQFLKWNSIGLNSEFSFSLIACLTKVKEPSLHYYLFVADKRIVWFIPFPKVLVPMWNANSPVQDLNLDCCVHFFSTVTLLLGYLYLFWWCPRGVMVKAMDCRIVVSEFELQSRYYIHFRTNTLGKGMNPLILPAMG